VIHSATSIEVREGAEIHVDGGNGAGASDRTGGNTQRDFNSIAFETPTGRLFSGLRGGSTTLWELNTTYAFGLQLGDLGHGEDDGEALCYNPDDGFLYHASGGKQSLVFEKVDPVTYVTTPITPDFLLTTANVSAITYRKEAGVLYWATESPSILFTVTTSGTATQIGTLDHIARGMAFRDDVLYTIGSSDKKIRGVDPTTAQTLSISSGDFRLPSFNLSGGFGMTRNPETDELWGLFNVTNQQAIAGHELATVDPETADVESIGTTYSYVNAPDNCRAKGPGKVGGGGAGGDGVIQLQLPGTQMADVEDPDGSLTADAWVDPMNLSNPAEFTPKTMAQSRWYDMGRAICRDGGTAPRFQFRGLDVATGRVLTDSEGYVLDPDDVSIRVDYLGQPDPQSPGKFLPGQEPRANFIPPNASVIVEFQGADAVAEGSKEVDPATVTEWVGDPSVADGMQFIRYRIKFDITADDSELEVTTPRPSVQRIAIDAEF
jgi:hypothetical protein